MLAQGDLRGALKAYATAAQTNRSNEGYVQQFLLVRQVVMLQDSLDKETDAARRTQLGQSLRAFYASQGLFGRALPIDQELYQRLGSPNAAIQLAETQLALEQAGLAAEVLSSLTPEQTTPATQSLLCVALVRQGKPDAARQLADRVVVDPQAGPGTLYIVARMQAAVGDSGPAVATLRRCFESVPPSRLEALRAHAQGCVDFASLHSGPEFKSALQTASKVTESTCSGGSSCSTCPLRGNCSSGSGP